MAAEYERDELYEHVFNTNEGKAFIGGMVLGLVSAVPAYVSLALISPNDSVQEQQKEVDSLTTQQTSLKEASSVLLQQGHNELSGQVADTANQLGSQATAIESQIPPHLGGDVVLYGLLLTPVLVGIASGTALYRFLKNQKISTLDL
jgi:hypothetical protein